MVFGTIIFIIVTSAGVLTGLFLFPFPWLAVFAMRAKILPIKSKSLCKIKLARSEF